MCGRLTIATRPEEIARLFADSPEVAADLLTHWKRPRYNVAPSQPVLAIRAAERLTTERRPLLAVDTLRWGLVPLWANDPAIGNRLVNARSEDVANKPSFKAAYRSRRCLVPASGFYEWTGEAKRRQPYYFQLADGQPFTLGGLWETWQQPDGSVLRTVALLTTAANTLMADLHDRIPVIIAPPDRLRWLDPQQGNPEKLAPLCEPWSPEGWIRHPVSPRVNSALPDDPELIAPVERLQPRTLDFFDQLGI